MNSSGAVIADEVLHRRRGTGGRSPTRASAGLRCAHGSMPCTTSLSPSHLMMTRAREVGVEHVAARLRAGGPCRSRTSVVDQVLARVDDRVDLGGREHRRRGRRSRRPRVGPARPARAAGSAVGRDVGWVESISRDRLPYARWPPRARARGGTHMAYPTATEADVTFFEEHGWIAVPDAVDVADLAELEAACEVILEQKESMAFDYDVAASGVRTTTSMLPGMWCTEAGSRRPARSSTTRSRCTRRGPRLGADPFATLDAVLDTLSTDGDATQLTRDRHWQPSVLGNRARSPTRSSPARWPDCSCATTSKTSRAGTSPRCRRSRTRHDTSSRRSKRRAGRSTSSSRAADQPRTRAGCTRTRTRSALPVAVPGRSHFPSRSR